MEFLEGEDLNEKIKRSGPLSQEAIKDIFVQTLSAFQYAHEKGVVHRDIKPSNIYVLPDGHVKILDFGIAKLFGQGNEMTQTGTQMGTPIYMSPEQVKADKSIDHRSDIYSLGVTMYYGITGKPPYNSDTTSQFDIYNKIVFEALPELPYVGNFDDFVKKACQKDRDQRFQSCEEWINLFHSKEPIIMASENKTIIESIPNSEKNEAHTPANDYRANGNEINNSNTTAIPKKPSNIKIITLSIIIVLCVLILASILFFNNETDKNTSAGMINNVADSTEELKNNFGADSTVFNKKNSNPKKDKKSELNFNGLPYVNTAIKINPNPRGGSQNVFFNKNYTLFDASRPDLPIFPVNKNGEIVYQIYYSSNEDPRPFYGEFTPSQLESHLYYKFKTKETCQEFCRSKSPIIWKGQNNDGHVSMFKKISNNEWTENSNNGSYFYYEVKNENGNYTLKDKNREGVLIYLTADKAYYKDNNTNKWLYIYFGSFK
jgi:serine/threonine protein kinase